MSQSAERMSACEHSVDGTFPCLPTTFIAWSSFSYLILPINIAIYDLLQLYLFDCNCFKYYPPFNNSFKTGIFSYILSILSIIHTIGCLECNECGQCFMNNISLYCIYFMLFMLSCIRLFSQYKIRFYYKMRKKLESNDHDTRIKAINNAKFVQRILFSSQYHWIFAFISLSIGSIFGIISSTLSMTALYGFSYCALILIIIIFEMLTRYVFIIKPKQRRSLRLQSISGTNLQPITLGSFEVHTENKRAMFSLILVIIAISGIVIDTLKMDINCMQIGYAIYHIFSAISLTIWYWSLVGEKWTFTKVSDIDIQQQSHSSATTIVGSDNTPISTEEVSLEME